mmetsp:Transcript_19133/g.23718  ORF Transcript_19133/g.23718 Transcript_19133/m.23718 type:complete len:135 (+) Transcript_19133:672-1076(+)
MTPKLSAPNASTISHSYHSSANEHTPNINEISDCSSEPPSFTSALFILPGFTITPSIPLLSTSQTNNLSFHHAILVVFLRYFRARINRDLSALDRYHKPGIDRDFSDNSDVANSLLSITLQDFISHCSSPNTCP